MAENTDPNLVALSSAAEDLDDSLTNFFKAIAAASSVSSDAILDSFSDLRNKFFTVANLIPGPTDNSVEFEEFFGGVSQSFMSAQRNLDKLSGDYLNDLRNPSQSHVIPSVFKIPKLSASIKCSFSKITSDSIQLIFYSSSTQQQSLNQQSVQFDIVAAPPPVIPPDSGTTSPPSSIIHSPPASPEAPKPALAPTAASPAIRTSAAVGPSAPAAPQLNFVTDPALRTRILTAVQGQKGVSDNNDFAKDFEVILGDFARVLILDASQQQYFLAYAKYTTRNNDESNLGIWDLNLAGAKPVMHAIYRYTLQPKKGEDVVVLQKLISDLGDEQQNAARS